MRKKFLAAVNKTRKKKVNPDRSTAYGWSSKTNPKCWLLWPLPPLHWTSGIRRPHMCHPSSRYRSWEVCFVFFFVILVWTNDEIRIRSGEKHLASEPCQREGGAAISWCCCRRASQVGAPVLVLAWRRNLVTAAKREAGEFSIKNIFLLSFVFFF